MAMTVKVSQQIKNSFFHFLFIICNGVRKSKQKPGLNSDGSIKLQQFQTPIAVDSLDLLTTTVDRKIV